jgi:hypothetical protein
MEWHLTLQAQHFLFCQFGYNLEQAAVEPNGMISHPMGLILDTIRSTSSISDANEHWETLFCLCESKGVANVGYALE